MYQIKCFMQAGRTIQYPLVSTEMQTCERGSAPKQFSQLVFTRTAEWRSRSVSTLCDTRKPIVSCPQETYVWWPRTAKVEK